jgi:NADH-quinone oxidoreductase subunit J
VTVFLFFTASALALGGALGVILARNPVHSALFLVLTLVAVAVFFLIEKAELDAAVQIIVYASAIVVLFLFVIMLLGVDKKEALEEPLKYQRPAALLLGAVVLGELIAFGLVANGVLATGHHTVSGVSVAKAGSDTNIERVAKVLFTDFLWPFQITAVLLVIAVVGAVVLARRSGQKVDTP